MRRVIVESPWAGDRERNDIYLNDCLMDCYIGATAPVGKAHRTPQSPWFFPRRPR